jgi:hypothetical protein
VATVDKIDTDAVLDGNVDRVHDSQQSPLLGSQSLRECEQAPCTPAARIVSLDGADGAGGADGKEDCGEGCGCHGR